jgi:catechol 2,3-dioxygenase-like lactoylglutathione lyase family enzyme
MQISKLDHVNIRTTELDSLIDWYTNVLGMRSGERPDFAFPGAWMYANDVASVHLIGIDGNPGAGSETDLKLEHFAFSASGRAKFESDLESFGIEFHRVEVASVNIIQINLFDPDGNHIHIDFPLDE